jgi:hypothetical protein
MEARRIATTIVVVVVVVLIERSGSSEVSETTWAADPWA